MREAQFLKQNAEKWNQYRDELNHNISTDTIASRFTELTDDLASIQRSKVVEVLRRELGNKAKAARVLGIERRKLYRLLEKFAIDDIEIQAVGTSAKSTVAS